MPTSSESAYHLFDEPAAPAAHERETDVLRKVHIFIRDRVIAPRNGKLPSTLTIAARLIVLQELIEPTGRSLRSYAIELGCSAPWLSIIGSQFSDSIGMRASWQRAAARAIYSERAKGVHAGTWVASSENGKWKRRQLREAKRKGKSTTSKNGKESITRQPQRR